MRYISLLLLLWQISTNSLVWNNTTVLTSQFHRSVGFSAPSFRGWNQACGSLGSYQQWQASKLLQVPSRIGSSFPVAKQGFYFPAGCQLGAMGRGGGGGGLMPMAAEASVPEPVTTCSILPTIGLLLAPLSATSLPQVEKVPFEGLTWLNWAHLDNSGYFFIVVTIILIKI